MANKDQDRTSQTDRSSMNDDDMVRGRSDVDDVVSDSDEFEDTEDLDEEDEEDEGSF